MKILSTKILGCYKITQHRHEDSRGYFDRKFSYQEFFAEGLEANWVQSNVSWNEIAGTIRGLHYQAEPNSEVKLVTCLSGAIFDVFVDLRPESESYLQHDSYILTSDLNESLYLPKGIAHGYQSLLDSTCVNYLVTTPYSPESARGYSFLDPTFSIEWPLACTQISKADLDWPSFQSPASESEIRD